MDRRQPDLSLIAPRLWVGAAVDGVDDRIALRQARAIREVGVHVVVDCRLSADDSDLWAAVGDVEYHRHGIEDSGHPIPPSWFTHGVEFVMDRWQIRGRGVFVHCEEGVNRSPCLVLAVLLVVGLSPQQAVERIVGARPTAGLRYAADAMSWFGLFADAEDAEFTPPPTTSSVQAGGHRRADDEEDNGGHHDPDGNEHQPDDNSDNQRSDRDHRSDRTGDPHP
ncbi:protein-tyrosine phosphatase family protein [Mycolicibacterium vanbaalenii]|uniref:hypothetical protein n=1 Tax=Mycolicibacterium vanbaalenii TaxID=110539 RepID=UPI0021F28E81|nr:hypothetical protein [Mycolicibacterium vanbaalenii]MCV7126976.1 dual specificity protein phosphatase family protein [Mycolicibacterium vanbaalenii PYR-1]